MLRRVLSVLLGSLRFRAVLSAFGAALATPDWIQARDEDLFVRPGDQHSVVFVSLDAGRSSFVSGGAKQTLTGPLDRTGFVLMESSGYGLTRERFRVDEIDLPAARLTQQNALLAGYQWSLDRVFLSAYLGPEMQLEQLTVANRVLRWSQPRFGMRGQFELWSHPTPETLLTATVVTGTTRTSGWARVSAGLRVFGDAYVGPEFTVYATPTYLETRVGAHLTGAGFGPVTLRLSAGWMSDDAHRRGTPYLGLTAWARL